MTYRELAHMILDMPQTDMDTEVEVVGVIPTGDRVSSEVSVEFDEDTGRPYLNVIFNDDDIPTKTFDVTKEHENIWIRNVSGDEYEAYFVMYAPMFDKDVSPWFAGGGTFKLSEYSREDIKYYTDADRIENPTRLDMARSVFRHSYPDFDVSSFGTMDEAYEWVGTLTEERYDKLEEWARGSKKTTDGEREES